MIGMSCVNRPRSEADACLLRQRVQRAVLEGLVVDSPVASAARGSPPPSSREARTPYNGPLIAADIVLAADLDSLLSAYVATRWVRSARAGVHTGDATGRPRDLPRHRRLRRHRPTSAVSSPARSCDAGGDAAQQRPSPARLRPLDQMAAGWAFRSGAPVLLVRGYRLAML